MRLRKENEKLRGDGVLSELEDEKEIQNLLQPKIKVVQNVKFINMENINSNDLIVEEEEDEEEVSFLDMSQQIKEQIYDTMELDQSAREKFD